jgi:hypothetical protein
MGEKERILKEVLRLLGENILQAFMNIYINTVQNSISNY